MTTQHQIRITTGLLRKRRKVSFSAVTVETNPILQVKYVSIVMQKDNDVMMRTRENRVLFFNGKILIQFEGTAYDGRYGQGFSLDLDYGENSVDGMYEEIIKHIEFTRGFIEKVNKE